MYYFPSIYKGSRITEFTNSGLPDIKRLKHPDYYMHIDTDGKEIVPFPQYIDGTIHNYYALQEEARNVVNSATSLICNGIDIRETMKSLSYVSFVSSIETMVNYEFRKEVVNRCVTCGNPMFKVMAKFRDYLFKYVANTAAAKKQINEIYSLRSRIAHTGLLLLGDNQIDWSDDKRKNEEWQTHLLAMQISRLSLANWLIMRGNEAEKTENSAY